MNGKANPNSGIPGEWSPGDGETNEDLETLRRSEDVAVRQAAVHAEACIFAGPEEGRQVVKRANMAWTGDQMIVRKIVALAAAAALALTMVVPANAITITNQDGADYELQIEEAAGGTSSAMIAAGESLEICEDGCAISLENGERETFEGDETVELRDGGFVRVE